MIGLRLKQIRDYLDISQEEFGKKIGIKGSAVSRYEKNDTVPTQKVLNNLVELYNVDLTWLLNGKGQMFKKEANPTELERLQQENEELTQEIGFVEVATRLLQVEKEVEKLKRKM